MEKSTSEMSKKMLEAAWTFIRATVVAMSGRSTDAAPVFGTLDASTMGNDPPLFVESRMFTLVANIGEMAVPATFHITVWLEDQVTLLFGAVTTNGPALLVTVTCMSAVLKPPPPARLSRATTRKFIVRLLVGSNSPGVFVWARMSDSCGNVRELPSVGIKDRNIGLLPLSVLVSVFEGPRSLSSQQNVSVSPFGSLPAAVRVKGVPLGIV